MGKRITSFGVLSQVPSATLNSMQDKGLNARPQGQNSDILSTNGLGIDGLVCSPTLSTSGGDLRLVDDSVDWRDRFIEGRLHHYGPANIPGAGSDFIDAFTLANGIIFFGYTGNGARSNLTTGAAVAAGAPPLSGAGTFRSYRVTVAQTASVAKGWLYADPTTGYLYHYSDEAGGSQVHLTGVIRATGKLGKR